MPADDGVTKVRPLTRRGAATRDRIVAAAASLVFEGGVAGTTIDDVMKAARVSASQMYHYFDDKQALVRAVIAHDTDTVLAEQQPMLSSLDSMEALRSWRDGLLDSKRRVQCRGGCPLGTLTAELAEVSPASREDLERGFDQWENAIRDGLQTMHNRGDLRRGVDPDRLALAVLAAVQGGMTLTQVHRDLAPLEAALDEMLEHIASLMPRRRAES